jgi:hypothetical protein
MTFTWPPPPPPPPTTDELQTVEVTTVTTGVRLDPDGYGVLNDEWDYDVGDGETVPIATNGTVNLHLRPGGHILSLVDVAANCSGKNLSDRPINAKVGVVTPVLFEVVCK